ncbi:unnamed protein product [Cyprideis torosa]|uniref:Uncharacterized protein n=1 Tax=Cyprideis torosa TaxID=163714 RepID=A0A7R8W8W1_9CRUS|nr:unnamed protein product [Cyprideis torosa]CAG0884209.1 unnamed protein product [Cyprideis torosa]
MAKTYDYLFKLLLIGDSGVGKTCLLFRFSEDAFNSTFISTIGIDFKIRTIELDGKKIKLQIWDTAGQERFRTITTAYYRGAMGIMLVYDITNERTFDNIRNWIRNIEEHASSDVEKMILGNKCDMEDKRQVSKERGQSLAVEYGVRFLETSAKSAINVDEAFHTLARDIKTKTEQRLVSLKAESNAPPKSSHIIKPGESGPKKTFTSFLIFMMDFAKAQLQKFGWREGSGLGKRRQGIREPIKAKLKNNRYGLGHRVNRKEEFGFAWWDHVFNAAIQSVQVDQDEGGAVKVVRRSDREEVEVTTKRRKKRKLEVEKQLQNGFLKRGVLTNGDLVETSSSAPTQSARPSTDGALQIVDEFELEEDLSSFRGLQDEEVFLRCGRMTGHKAARIGHSLNGKLRRLAEQEQGIFCLKTKVNSSLKEQYRKKQSEDVVDLEEDLKQKKKTKKRKKRRAAEEEGMQEKGKTVEVNGKRKKGEDRRVEEESDVTLQDNAMEKENPVVKKKKKQQEVVEEEKRRSTEEKQGTSGSDCEKTSELRRRKRKKEVRGDQNADDEVVVIPTSAGEEVPKRKKKKKGTDDDVEIVFVGSNLETKNRHRKKDVFSG